MDGRPDRRPNLRTHVDNARDAALVLALLLSPTAHAQENEEDVVAFSGANFSTGGGFNTIAPGPRFEVPPRPDPDVWVPSGTRVRRPAHERAMDPRDTFDWGDARSYSRFDWHRDEGGVDVEASRVDGEYNRSGFDIDDDRVIYRIPR